MFAKIWDNPYLRFLLLLAVLAGVGLLFWNLRSVFVAFLVAFLLAYLLSPFVDRVAKRTNRALGVLSVFVILLLMLGLLWLLGIQIAAQFSTFVVAIPLLIETLQELPFRTARMIDPRFGNIFQQVYLNLERLFSILTDQLLPGLLAQGQGGQGSAVQVLRRVVGGGAQVAIVFVLSLYLLYNFPTYTRSFLRVFPHRYRSIVEDIVSTAGVSVGGYVRGQIFIAFCVGVMVFIGLAIIQVPLALALGVLAGVANLIPFLGPILAAVPTAFLGLTESTGHMIGAVAVLVVANQIDGNILTPMVFSRVISLDPVTVLIAILLGGTLFGFVGALVAVPAAAFLKVMYTSYYLDSKWYRRSTSPPPV